MEKTVFSAGFGKADVTPPVNVFMTHVNGQPHRVAELVADSLEAMTLALTDGNGETLLLTVTDLGWGHIDMANSLRKEILDRFGIPGDHVMLAGTGNCSGPQYAGPDAAEPINVQYLKKWSDGVLESVAAALQDRKPAKVEIARTKTEKLNFNRRYWRKDGNLTGAMYQRYYASSNSPLAGYEAPVDEQVQLVRFVREGDKDILLSQWQCRPNHTMLKQICNSDWVGPMRRKVEKELDCHCIYFQGAAGNIDSVSRLQADYIDRTRIEVGEALADAVIAATKDKTLWQQTKTGKIRTTQTQFVSMLPGPELDGVGGEWTGEVNSLSFGEVSVVTLPVDIFSAIGEKIKAASPFAMTVLMGFCNGIHGYVPDAQAQLHGGYEAHSRGVYNTEDKLLTLYKKQLTQLYGEE